MKPITEMSREEIAEWVVNTLHEMFDIDKEQLIPTAHLYADLDIDSIDAVDLAVKLKEFTGKRLQPESFKTIRTVDDVIDAVTALLTESDTEEAAEEQLERA